MASVNSTTIVEEGAFENLPMLEHLYLNENLIENLPRKVFANLTSLELLELSGNLIQYLDPTIFQDLESLKYINLDDNKLSKLDPNLFKGLTCLENISLNGNQLCANESLELNLEDSVDYIMFRQSHGLKETDEVNEAVFNDIDRIKKSEVMDLVSVDRTMTPIDV